MAFKTPPTQEERLRQRARLEREAKEGMADYLREQVAVNENMQRLRALRLAKEAEQAEEAQAKPQKRASARKPAVKRGIGSH